MFVFFLKAKEGGREEGRGETKSHRLEGKGGGCGGEGGREGKSTETRETKRHK